MIGGFNLKFSFSDTSKSPILIEGIHSGESISGGTMHFIKLSFNSIISAGELSKTILVDTKFENIFEPVIVMVSKNVPVLG
jgi:hypothetical protein